MEKYSKEIFLAVVGTSPQVITEIIYYYNHPFYNQNINFDKIKAFGTTASKKEITNNLFDRGILNNMAKTLKLDAKEINFKEEDIIVFKDSSNKEIDDIRSTDNTVLSFSEIFNYMRKYTEDDKTRITATVAGGRKSMASIMSLAFQVFGRSHDRLIHVMVDDKKMFDGRDNDDPKKWYYPKKASSVSEKIEIINIPVLRIGKYLPLQLDGDYNQVIEQIQKYFNDTSPVSNIVIDKNNFIANDEKFKVSPISASYLRYFLDVRKKSGCNKSCQGCERCFKTYDQITIDSQTVVIKHHEEITGDRNQHFINAKEYRNQFNVKNYNLSEQDYGYYGLYARNREYICRLRKDILNTEISKKFKDSITPKMKNINNLRYYGLLVDPTKINFKE